MGDNGSNRTKLCELVLVEHVFGASTTARGGTLVRTIGLARVASKVGMKNLACNMRLLFPLRRLTPRPA